MYRVEPVGGASECEMLKILIFLYLGIIITPNTAQLFKANNGKLMKEITADLTKWDVLALSLIGRIETIRMNVLPRLLFLF